MRLFCQRVLDSWCDWFVVGASEQVYASFKIMESYLVSEKQLNGFWLLINGFVQWNVFLFREFYPRVANVVLEYFQLKQKWSCRLHFLCFYTDELSLLNGPFTYELWLTEYQLIRMKALKNAARNTRTTRVKTLKKSIIVNPWTSLHEPRIPQWGRVG